MDKLLEIKNLKTVFNNYSGKVFALNEVSLSIGHGEVLGIVGESGSGKSTLMLSVMKLLPESGTVTGGEIIYNGRCINELGDREMQNIRGKEIGMVFQDPMTSLNPVFTTGQQLMEAILRHNNIPRADAKQKALNALRDVGITGPEKRFGQYPHELSGGMRQRVMLAMALINKPRLLIADEPTTGLDVTIQAQILELVKDLAERTEMSIILITHDFGIVAEICRRVVVMYGGMLVEQGSVGAIFREPGHPYTAGLLRSIPQMNKKGERLKYIEGQPPDMSNPPEGCPFIVRCPDAMEICSMMKPPYMEAAEGHGVACWLPFRENGGDR